MDSAEQIVRELAEHPRIDHDYEYKESWCCLCDMRQDFGPGPDFGDPANHEPACLWRRARELYPAASVCVCGRVEARARGERSYIVHDIVCPVCDAPKASCAPVAR